jgi:hypothetical protein
MEGFTNSLWILLIKNKGYMPLVGNNRIGKMFRKKDNEHFRLWGYKTRPVLFEWIVDEMVNRRELVLF